MWKSHNLFFSNRFANSEIPISFNISHIVLISIFELVQNFYGQSYYQSLIDIFFFMSLLTIFHNYSFYPIIAFISFVYEAIEVVSWIYISSGITFQILSAMEFIYGLNTMPDNIMRIFYWSILLFGFCNVEFLKINFRFSNYEFYIFIMLLLVLFYPFISDKYMCLYPFRINGLMSKKLFDKIITSFTSKQESSFESPIHKNLILIEVESFETKCIGKFNSMFPKSMPFLSNLSNHILHYSQIKSQPYTTWSAAGMFVAHCGFPLIVNNVETSVRELENFEMWKTLPCISSYLENLGYTQKAFCTGSCDVANMKSFIVDHHFQTYDMTEHGIDRDSVLFNHLENDIIPDLIKASREGKKPFNLFILTADTHPEFWIDDKFCTDLTDEHYQEPEENNNQNEQNGKDEKDDDEKDEKENKSKNDGDKDEDKKVQKEDEKEETEKNQKTKNEKEDTSKDKKSAEEKEKDTSKDKKSEEDKKETRKDKKSEEEKDTNKDKKSEKHKKKNNNDEDDDESEKKNKKKSHNDNNDDDEKSKKSFLLDNLNGFNDMNQPFRSHEPLPKILRCFTCFDRILKKFYNKLLDYGLNASNTVFVVYGDHLTMGERYFVYGEDRTLSMIFPFITKDYLVKNLGTTKKLAEKKNITYYDFAPTILDLMNIKYSPEFPFGNSAFSVEQTSVPTVDDFKFIYNYLTGDIKYEKVHCRNEEGFCTGNEY